MSGKDESCKHGCNGAWQVMPPKCPLCGGSMPQVGKTSQGCLHKCKKCGFEDHG